MDTVPEKMIQEALGIGDWLASVAAVLFLLVLPVSSGVNKPKILPGLGHPF